MSNSNKSDSKSSRRRYFRRSKSEPPKPATDSPSPSSPSEEKSDSGGSSEKPRRSSGKSRSDRSRSNRSRSGNSTAKNRARVERPSGKGSRDSNRNLKRPSNNETRQRRRRRRHAEEVEPVEKNNPSSGPSIIDAIQKEYRSPQDVYSYTHVIRPDQRDAYEFRSDHFSNTSRHLEDYTIDLSSILDEAGEITLKHFFQEMPEDVDFETVATEEPHTLAEEDRDESRDRPRGSTNDHPRDDVGVDIDDGKPSAKNRKTERRKDSKKTSKQNVDDDLEVYFVDDEKSLEQIYDELEMFTEDTEA